jgi:lipopolysaccharide export system protein LptC
MSGTHAQHYPDTDMLDIQTVVMRGENKEGQAVTARADQALATGDGNLVTLKGNVQFTQPASIENGKQKPALEVRSQEITAYVKEERMISDVPVEIRRGSDLFTADRMQLNSKTGEYELMGKVRGVVHAMPR